MTLLLFVVVIYINISSPYCIPIIRHIFTPYFGGWGSICLKKSKKRERGRVRFFVNDSPQPLVKNSHSHTKKASNDVTHFLKPTPHTHYCIIIFTVGIYLRTDRYLKDYSIEREIWSIEEEQTNARARRRRGDVSGHIFVGDKREKR